MAHERRITQASRNSALGRLKIAHRVYMPVFLSLAFYSGTVTEPEAMIEWITILSFSLR